LPRARIAFRYFVVFGILSRSFGGVRMARALAAEARSVGQRENLGYAAFQRMVNRFFP
jgi:hypothetical protein